MHIYVALCILVDALEELMSKRKWQNHYLRANVAQPDDTIAYGTFRVAKIYSKVLDRCGPSGIFLRVNPSEKSGEEVVWPPNMFHGYGTEEHLWKSWVATAAQCELLV